MSPGGWILAGCVAAAVVLAVVPALSTASRLRELKLRADGLKYQTLVDPARVQRATQRLRADAIALPGLLRRASAALAAIRRA